MATERHTNTKTNKVAQHLFKHKSITSLQANDLYAVSRLSSIIYNLRYDKQWQIDSVMKPYVDKKGNKAIYAKYTLRSTTPPIKKQIPKKHKK